MKAQACWRAFSSSCSHKFRANGGNSMHRALITAVAWLALVALPASSSAQHFPPDDSLVALISPLVGDGLAKGIVLGLLEPDGSTRIVFHGSPGEGARPLGAGSVFDVGSVSKVFTATVLADMVAKGEASLDDPVAMYLPQGLELPSGGGEKITLLHLATHQSGLPRLPTNLVSPDVDYTVDQLYEFLAEHELRREPGAEFEYSNLGFGLLGHALGLAAGGAYEDVLRRRVLEPLGMEMTGFPSRRDVGGWMVEGHDPGGNPVPRWYLPEPLRGGGGLNSSAEDMLAFLAANTGAPSSGLELAMRDAQAVRIDPYEDVKGGLAWQIRHVDGRRVLSHSGGSRGFRSFITFDAVSGAAVVLLSNSAADNTRLNQLGVDLVVGLRSKK